MPLPDPALFIHIPKTGGTYVGQRDYRQAVIRPIIDLNHSCVITRPRVLNPLFEAIDLSLAHKFRVRSYKLLGKFIFSIVRNPWDWLVSYYFHAGGFNPKYRDPDHYDFDLAQKGFEALVRAVAERDRPWPNRRLMFPTILDDQGSLVVDYLCRTHTLDQDLQEIASLRGMQYCPKDPLRVGRTDKRDRDYRTFYDDALAELVQRTWLMEIALYGFDFEEVARERAIIPRRCAHLKGVHLNQILGYPGA